MICCYTPHPQFFKIFQKLSIIETLALLTHPFRTGTVIQMEQVLDIPSWLTSHPVQQTVTLPLEPLSTYEIVFERMLVAIASTGVTLSEFVREHHLKPDTDRFRSWVHSNPERQKRYYDARAIGAELVEEELLTIADALNDPMEDVQRSKLRIDTRKWVLGVWNRKRYGEKQQIEINETKTYNIRQVLEEREKRLAGVRPMTIEGEATRVE